MNKLGYISKLADQEKLLCVHCDATSSFDEVEIEWERDKDGKRNGSCDTKWQCPKCGMVNHKEEETN